MDIFNYVKVKKKEKPPPNIYRPKRSADVLCDDLTRERIREYVRRFEKRDPSMKKMLVVGGPSGIGKSLLSTLILEEAGYRVRVMSSIMTKKEMIDFIADIVPESKTAIIVDDLDVIMDATPGIAQDLMTYVNPLKGKRRATKKDKETCAAEHWTVPIVATCKHPHYGKVSDVSKQCEVVCMTKPSRSAMISYLQSLAPSHTAIEKIVDDSKRDVRQAIITLGSSSGTSPKDDDVDTIRAITTMMMRNKTPASVSTTLRMAHVDMGLIPMMMFENYLDVCALHGEDATDVSMTAADAMSMGDVMENAMYTSGRFDMYDAYLAFSVVAPAMTVRTASSHVIRFGNMWSRISNMHVKRSVFRNIRDAVPGMWNVSDSMGRYEYADLLKTMYLKHAKGRIADVCSYPKAFIDLCRFGIRPCPLSLVSLQTIYKRLLKEKNILV